MTPGAPLLNPASDLSGIAEQMCRIEHKLDLILTHLATTDGSFLIKKMTEDNIDPITLEHVRYYMDFFKRHVVRQCGDGTGLLPPASILFTPQQVTATGGSNGGSNSSGGDSGF